jgi:hypothetical protein
VEGEIAVDKLAHDLARIVDAMGLSRDAAGDINRCKLATIE